MKWKVNVLTLAANGDLYAGAGAYCPIQLMKWNGTTWSALSTGTGILNGNNQGTVTALALAPNGDVYMGGSFTQVGGVAANYVARLHGTAWSSLGMGAANGVNGTVYALALAPNGDVYVGGDFTQAGGIAARYLAKWNGAVWNAVGPATTPLKGAVSSLATAGNGSIYVSDGPVHRWDGSVWSTMSQPITPYAVGLAVASNGDVYLGTSGRPDLVWKWNGTTFNPLGNLAGNLGNLPGHGGIVILRANALVVDNNGTVYAGGFFPGFGVKQWDGQSWTWLPGNTPEIVYALALGPNGKLYVGGSFTSPGVGFGIYDPNAIITATTTSTRTTPTGQLFPNPAHGTATLRLPATAPRQPLTLTDALGRLVRQYPAPTGPEAVLDLRGLPTGVYVVRCGELSQRLVVE